MNDIKTLRRVAITSQLVSVINEENLPATELMARAVKKINECVGVVNTLAERIEGLVAGTDITVENEELVLSVAESIEKIKADSLALAERTADPYSINAMTTLELSACTTKLVNECARLINELATDLDTVENTLNVAIENDELILEDA